jgi:hypothetical protein
MTGIYLGRKPSVSTTKQKEAAKKNIEKARGIQSARAHGAKIPRQTRGLSTADQDKLPDSAFAFPKERKEPLTDARHIRNAISRFDQVEGITDTEKDAAWKRIIKAAKKCDVEVSESSWRELGHTSKPRSSRRVSSKSPTGKSASAKSPSSKSPTAKKSSPKISSTMSASTKTVSAKIPSARSASAKSSSSSKSLSAKGPSSKASATKSKASTGAKK